MRMMCALITEYFMYNINIMNNQQHHTTNLKNKSGHILYPFNLMTGDNSFPLSIMTMENVDGWILGAILHHIN